MLRAIEAKYLGFSKSIKQMRQLLESRKNKNHQLKILVQKRSHLIHQHTKTLAKLLKVLKPYLIHQLLNKSINNNKSKNNKN